MGWFLAGIAGALIGGPVLALAVLAVGFVVNVRRAPLENPDLWSALLGLFTGETLYLGLVRLLPGGEAGLPWWVLHVVSLAVATGFVFGQVARRLDARLGQHRRGG